MSLPLLAITMGDPAGVGPELIARIWSDPAVHQICRPVVVGHSRVMRRACEKFQPSVAVIDVDSVEKIDASLGRMPCWSVCHHTAAAVAPCEISARGGQAAYDSLCAAADWAKRGLVAGVVTAPLHKAALWAAGHHYPGHTELLAHLCGIQNVAMMLYLPPGDKVVGRVGLGVAHVTLHMALRDVAKTLSVDSILRTARLANQAARNMLDTAHINEQPRIAVCAFNPHAGEQGLFGDEESQIIAPAVESGRNEGLPLFGPLPADTLMMRAAEGEFDVVVAMYHDQGHIALKLLGMHSAVNVTLGLPIIRTSVAHGTAFDLAWQGRAETTGMIAAITTAAQLVRLQM